MSGENLIESRCLTCRSGGANRAADERRPGGLLRRGPRETIFQRCLILSPKIPVFFSCLSPSFLLLLHLRRRQCFPCPCSATSATTSATTSAKYIPAGFSRSSASASPPDRQFPSTSPFGSHHRSNPLQLLPERVRHPRVISQRPRPPPLPNRPLSIPWCPTRSTATRVRCARLCGEHSGQS